MAVALKKHIQRGMKNTFTKFFSTIFNLRRMIGSTIIYSVVGLLLMDNLTAQEDNKLVIKPTLAFQLWGSYSSDIKVYNETTQQYDAVDNRLNFQLHRSRMGWKGSYGNRWVYDMTGSLDFVGQDALAGTVGAVNNGGSPKFRIWNALIQYKASESSEGLYITMGYQCPQLSRESITSPFVVGSFEKAWSQNYIRRHAIGTGPGRAAGVNIGGLTNTQDTKFALNYDFGIYNPHILTNGANNGGINTNPLLTYRLGIHLGDPETASYSRGKKFNTRGARQGITLAVSGSYQGTSDIWDDNSSFGIDLLANYGLFNISGEWMQLKRSLGSVESTATTGFIKLGYSSKLQNGKEIEPVIAYVFLDGALDRQAHEDTRAVGAFAGKDNYLELTLNYYVTPKIRWSVSYTLRNGDEGDADPILVNNNFFQQGGIGPFNKGDYLGVGLLFSI